jgi:hypothetical protein
MRLEIKQICETLLQYINTNTTNSIVRFLCCTYMIQRTPVTAYTITARVEGEATPGSSGTVPLKVSGDDFMCIHRRYVGLIFAVALQFMLILSSFIRIHSVCQTIQSRTFCLLVCCQKDVRNRIIIL